MMCICLSVKHAALEYFVRFHAVIVELSFFKDIHIVDCNWIVDACFVNRMGLRKRRMYSVL